MREDPDKILEDLRERYDSEFSRGIFTDGGASPNPGAGGWAVVMVDNNDVVKRLWGHEPFTTNNRMELTAILEAYKLLPADSDMTIFSDSRLCVNSINLWMDNWARNNWRSSNKKPVKNVELLKAIYAQKKLKPKVEVRWVEAHAGRLWNEYAHRLAALGRRGQVGKD